jgi:hypothetical protein
LNWENLIEANRPPQMEQETTTQREIPPPQTEVEAEPTQITKAQTSKTQELTKRKKRIMVSFRSPLRKRRRRKQTQETTKEIQDATDHPEELQNFIEQPLQDNQSRQHKRIIRETPNLQQRT